MLERLARFCFRRRGRVLAAWIVALVVLQGAAGAIGPDWRADQSLPDSESQEVQDLLETANPAQAGFTGQIVFEADQGIDDPDVQAAMEDLFADVEALDPGVEVKSPYSPEGAEQVSQVAPIAFAEVNVSDRNYEEMVALGNDIKDLEDGIDVEGLRIEFGGEMFAEFELPASEALGILAAIIILIVAFGSVVAMGLPIGTALFGLGTGVALTMLLSRVQSMPDFAPQLTAMIGLGVGIDYALFIVTRYREGLHAGLEPEDATAAAVDTSGRAVLFAGATVIISLLGLYIMGLAFVRGLATGAAAGVLFMMVAAVTLLPAFIGFAGRKIEVTKWRGGLATLLVTGGALLALLLGAPIFLLIGLLGLVLVVVGSYTFAPKLRGEVPHRKPKPLEQQNWFRWSRVVQHQPWFSFLVGLTILVVLALPVFGLRLGFGDTGNYNEKQTVRQAYDLIAEGFGPGYNGPIIVTVSGEDASNPDTLAAFGETLAQTDHVATVSPPIPITDGLSLFSLYADSAPQDKETTELVHGLRDDVIPASGVDAMVGGFNAASVDFAEYLGDRLPYLIGAVLLLSFILLMLVFRSLLVPLKAVVMNLLSIGAAYGVVIAVFQWGWGAGLIGVDREGPIEAWVR